MKIITIKQREVELYDVDDFPYEKFCGRTTISRGRKNYVDMISTFDIESTSILKTKYPLVNKSFGFMYLWNMCVDGICIAGRTWEEWLEFLQKLSNSLDCRYRKLIIYVHNLAFEFEFIKDFLTIEDIFAKKERNVAYFTTDAFEFRCSFMLTNMSLDKFTKTTPGVYFTKMNGEDFDYSIERYPDTELTNDEYGYGICDVLGLWEALTIKLQSDGDDIISVPMTSTGYVRRDYRNKCINNTEHMKRFKRCKLTDEDYLLCKEASRGAISGSNHINTNELLEFVQSFDIKSSYPFQMATKYFPNSKFTKVLCKYDTSKFRTFIDNCCCLITWQCENFHLREYASIPYVSKAKCRAISKENRVGNGKVYHAKQIGMCCTEIDFRIIEQLYKFDNPVILDMRVAERGMLSKAFREHLLEMFQTKTDLDYDEKTEDQEFAYNKYKNKINASFGMLLTDILNGEVVYNKDNTESQWSTIEVTNLNKALYDYYRHYNSFLNYQDGVWVLAHARDDLNTGMQVMKSDLVQVDTDSVKGLCDIRDYRQAFEAINEKIIKNAETYDVKPYAIKGDKKIYLGIWEYEGTYRYFKTLGAKKYCYRKDEDSPLKITVAGLRKKAGEWIDEHGGMDIFSPGTIIPPGISGRTAAVYNDRSYPHYRAFNRRTFLTGSNIAIANIDYTFGMTEEWLNMVMDQTIRDDVSFAENGAWNSSAAELNS